MKESVLIKEKLIWNKSFIIKRGQKSTLLFLNPTNPLMD